MVREVRVSIFEKPSNVNERAYRTPPRPASRVRVAFGEGMVQIVIVEHFVEEQAMMAITVNPAQADDRQAFRTV